MANGPEVTWENANPAAMLEAVSSQGKLKGWHVQPRRQHLHPRPPAPVPTFILWNFAVGGSLLKPGHKLALTTVVVPQLKGTTASISVEGHASNSGSLSSNGRLSKARAVATRDHLIHEGIPAARFVPILPFGEQFPLVPNTSPENMARNRCVIISLTETL